jgi:hypothetical protein
LRGGEKSIEAATPETEYLQEWLAQESKRGLTGFLKRKD